MPKTTRDYMAQALAANNQGMAFDWPALKIDPNLNPGAILRDTAGSFFEQYDKRREKLAKDIKDAEKLKAKVDAEDANRKAAEERAGIAQNIYDPLTKKWSPISESKASGAQSDRRNAIEARLNARGFEGVWDAKGNLIARTPLEEDELPVVDRARANKLITDTDFTKKRTDLWEDPLKRFVGFNTGNYTTTRIGSDADIPLSTLKTASGADVDESVTKARARKFGSRTGPRGKLATYGADGMLTTFDIDAYRAGLSNAAKAEYDKNEELKRLLIKSPDNMQPAIDDAESRLQTIYRLPEKDQDLDAIGELQSFLVGIYPQSTMLRAPSVQRAIPTGGYGSTLPADWSKWTPEEQDKYMKDHGLE
jgi:hypothetical protein